MSDTAAADNLRYYEGASDGVRDYWRYMAAPRHRAATLRAAIAANRPGSVVDLGCGDGSLLRVIASAVSADRYAGIDLSPAQIARNREELPAFTWHVADLDRPQVDCGLDQVGRFAAVVASEVIEHLDHPSVFLAHARSLAEVGGRLYLSTQSGPVRETERRVGHRRHFEAGELEALLHDAGWTPERTWNTGFPFHDASKWWANRNPDRSMASFGGEAYGFGQRAVCAVLRLLFRLNSQRRGAQLFAVARAA